jgi:hypothetical protein
MKPEKPPKAISPKVAILFLLVLFAGCEEFPDHQPRAVFISHHINYAWGYQDSGFVIDAEGNVRSFNMPESWNYHDSQGYISVADMEQNLAQLEEPHCKVSKYDLLFYGTKLEKALKGKITEPEHQMCDAGSTTVAGYIYESATNRYRYVFLRQTGDFYRENTSREAGDIYEWMQDPCSGSPGVRLR